MFTDHHLPYRPERTLRPDRRLLPSAHEIRLRARRAAQAEQER